MRQPTPLADQLAWWRYAADAGARPTSEWPECGYFKHRLEPRSKIWLPARITLQQTVDWQTGQLTEPERFRLEMRGRLILDQDWISREWLFLFPVSMTEWKWLRARSSLHGFQSIP